MFYILMFILFALGDVARISFFNQEVNVYLYEILYFSWLGWLVIKYKLAPLKNAKWKWLNGFIVILFGTFLLSMLKYNVFQNFVGLLYLVRLTGYLLGIPYVLHHVAKVKNKFYLSGLMLYLCVTFLFSLVQYGLYPNLRNLRYLGWDPHLYRAFGLVFDVSIAAAIYGLIFLFLLFRGKQVIKSAAPQLILVVVYGAVALLTYSRGMYVAMTMTLLYYLLIRNRKFISGLWLIVFIAILLVALPKQFGEGVNLLRTSTIGSRVESYQEGIQVWQEQPIFGVGYNHIRYSQEPVPQVVGVEGVSHAGASFHSSFLIILATTGILGLFFFMMFLYSLWQISPTTQIYVLFLSIYSLFDNILLHPFVLFFLTMLLILELKNHFA